MVAKPPPGGKSGDDLKRTAFVTSRLADFVDPDKLRALVGHAQSVWPEVILKELVDNALDAAEGAGEAPEIEITINSNAITVKDNGGGMPTKTIRSLLSLENKTSTNSAIVSPTRGQQGHAFQTLLAMGHALTRKPGVTIIESHGVRHTITLTSDPISRKPSFALETKEIAKTDGTKIIIFLTVTPSDGGSAFNVAYDFAAVNPHLTMTFNSSFAFKKVEFDATDPWWTKWKPTDKPPAHWYDQARLRALIAAEIMDAKRNGRPPLPVRDFIAKYFRGLASTVKRAQICDLLHASRESIDAYVERRYVDDTANDNNVYNLLLAMQKASKPVRPNSLGVIGRDHVERMIGEGRYEKAEKVVDGVPYLIEVGFGYRPKAKGRLFVCGINWSAAVGGNPFNELSGEGLESILTDLKAGPKEPIGVFAHVACPKPIFTDLGKSSLALPAVIEEAIVALIKKVTSAWTRRRKAEERDPSARLRRDDLMDMSAKPMTQKDAAWTAIPAAYEEASADGKGGHLPVKPRQILYKARRKIMDLAKITDVNNDTFTQQHLIPFMRENPDLTKNWDIVFDARGHLREPHTRLIVPLGTLEVRRHIAAYAPPRLIDASFGGARVEMRGPDGRYSALLYIEKEGFDELIAHAKIAERFDIMTFSCKGMSVTAARQLVDQTCARFTIPLFILRDFDIAGFSIAHTLHQSNARFTFTTQSGVDFKVDDLGLRLADAQALGLDSEPVFIDPEDKDATRDRLEDQGATDTEIDFLLSGRRVELNAMTSRQFVDFIETKLRANSVAKIVPDGKVLDDAYQVFARQAKARKIVETALAADVETVDAPSDLEERVRHYLAAHPESSWDQAVEALAVGKGKRKSKREDA